MKNIKEILGEIKNKLFPTPRYAVIPSGNTQRRKKFSR